VPDGHISYLRLYSSDRDYLPMFQFHFGKPATIPFLDANKFGLVGLKLILMTSNTVVVDHMNITFMLFIALVISALTDFK